MFVRTETILDKILSRKVEEVAAARTAVSLDEVRAAADDASPPRDFAGALRRETVALIAEIKRASPSKGVLIDPFDPVALAATYAGGGAAAISVLTDADFFGGALDHLRAVRAAVTVPILRKDFTLDAYQVYEARAAGADAMLLIAAALTDTQLAELHGLITALGMAALVEVHDGGELSRALALGARLIGVNNRDLRTFREDIGTTARLAALIAADADVTLVAESAVRTLDDVRAMGAAGARAVLVGEGLVRADNIAEQVRQFSSVRR